MSQSLGFHFVARIPVAGYPPSFLYVFALLATLPPRVAMEIGCLIAILLLTRWLLGARLTARGWLFVSALTIISRTVSYNLYYSQVQLLLAVFVLAAYAMHRAGRHNWACLVISAAGILKFFPFVLLPWFAWSGGGPVRTRVYRLVGAGGFVLAIVA